MFGSFYELPRYFGMALAEVVSFREGSITATHGGWGGDVSGSPIATFPWFVRGGQSNNAAGAGVFSFSGLTGGTDTSISFRPIIAGQ